MPQKLSERGEVVWLQQGRVLVAEVDYTAGKSSQGGVLQGILRYDWGALAEHTASHKALGQSALLPFLT